MPCKNMMFLHLDFLLTSLLTVHKCRLQQFFKLVWKSGPHLFHLCRLTIESKCRFSSHKRSLRVWNNSVHYGISKRNWYALKTGLSKEQAHLCTLPGLRHDCLKIWQETHTQTNRKRAQSKQRGVKKEEVGAGGGGRLLPPSPFFPTAVSAPQRQSFGGSVGRARAGEFRAEGAE